MREKQSALSSFFEHYPRVFHVSLCPRSSTIKSAGLFSAAGLLACSALSSEEREHILFSQRKTTLILQTDFGETVLNDQFPLPAKALLRCLNGISPQDWYAEMNERIFFFLNEDKARSFGSVRADKLPARTLLCLNSKNLIAGLEDDFELCAFNSGNAMRRAVRRDRNSFQTIDKYPLIERARKYGWHHAVSELSIRRRSLSISHALESVMTL
jgi:hypothetical protein